MTFYPFYNGSPLTSMFDWAGSKFPFAGATDLAVTENTTWNDTTGFKKIKKLTISAGVTITITKSPFYIFAEEIEGLGAGCIIDASGPNGTLGLTPFTCGQAWGGTVSSPAAQAGCGGGLLHVVCTKFSGTAITIKANGGTGYVNTTKIASGNAIGCGGQGALSNKIPIASTTNSANEVFDGTGTYQAVHTLALFFVSSPDNGGTGGGSGASGGMPTGGSGIGAAASNSHHGGSALSKLNPQIIYLLATYGCKGGGAGAAFITNGSAASNYVTGAGGGAIVVYTNDILSVTPILEANGSYGSGAASAYHGGAGYTAYVNLAA